jgi:hypothetical protein
MSVFKPATALLEQVSALQFRDSAGSEFIFSVLFVKRYVITNVMN